MAVGTAVATAGITAVAAAGMAAAAETSLPAPLPPPAAHADTATMPRTTPGRSNLREERLNTRLTYLAQLVSGSSDFLAPET